MNFTSIRLEGSILTADLLDAVAREDKHSQKSADFGLDPSDKVKDEIASTWASAKALWTGYQAKITHLREGQSGVSETRNLFIIPLLALLGYQPERAEAETVNGKSYAISHRDPSRDAFPLHIMGWHDSLEQKRVSGGPRVSPHALVQEYLNLTEHLYGLITNGRQLRLLRDSSRLIKLSFLEFDLQRIFTEDLYADFAILFRLLHATRMPANRANAAGCVIEKYHQDSVDSGSRIRDGLAAAVAYAMQTVANGLLAHPANASLGKQLRDESALAGELHQNLLRWVYRTLFVLVIEERGLNHAPDATLRQHQLYRDYYSLQRLRRLADRPQLADRRAYDLWRAMHQTLRLYEDGGKGLPLGIAPLGSFLFREEGLKVLFQYQLDNRSLLQALNRLSTFTHPDTNVRMRVNYGALDVEEFGSVYESLLELRPRVIPEGEKLVFRYAQLAGNERKTTGSYYTPDSLVQCLLDSALDPVIEERLAKAKQDTETQRGGGEKGEDVSASPHLPVSVSAAEQALLSIKVCDPAVGSGHFLIGAAHRLARQLAEIRAGEEALSPDVQRRALRDVISHCLYGVDINPLSVELCKVSLWMLAMEAGKPLSFLDHHIRCGNSLLGATPELIAEGIPDDAFKAIEGDDKKACAALKKLNARERRGFGELFALEDRATSERLQQAALTVESLPDDSIRAVEQKSAAFDQLQHNYDFQKATDLADLWCAAFVIRKRFAEAADADTLSASTGERDGVRCRTDDAPSPEQAGLFGETFAVPAAKQTKSVNTTTASSLAEAVGITSGHLRDFAKDAALPDGLMGECRQLSEQYRFFHWHLAFPEVFKHDGFDIMLGNPPWERVALQEKEWFAERRPDIASASNAVGRKKGIASLEKENPELWAEWQKSLRQADGEVSILRNSGRYPLCGRGDVNTYSIFTELNRTLTGKNGRAGCIVPTGIATDATTQLFFKDLIETRALVCLYGFENEGKLFEGVDHRVNFCVLVVGKKPTETDAEFSAFVRHPEVLRGEDRRYRLSASDIALLNPNTHTCPVFRSSRDAEITKGIYRRVPVLSNESNPSGDPWRVNFQSMFHMSGDSALFQTREVLEADGWKLEGNVFVRGDARMLPLYEAKMIYHFNHRFGDFALVEPGERAHILPTPGQDLLARPDYVPMPRYWVTAGEVATRVDDWWLNQWFIGWRDVTDPRSSVRTVVASVIPRTAVSGKFPLLLTQESPTWFVYAILSSFVFDYVARQKLGGVSLSMFVMRQLPVLPPAVAAGACAWSDGKLTLKDWVSPRVLELTYTTWDLEAFAQDCGWSGPPFRWDEERRFQLRCELDAAFFHLYGLNRDDTAYILDTFPIVKRKDEEKHSHYRTKETILALYDALAESQRTGKAFVSPLNPPPADARCCHPPKQDAVVHPRKPSEFASFAEAYPSNAADKLVCAIALEIVAWRESVSSDDHLDALILATHPELCRIFMGNGNTSQLDSWSASINRELKAVAAKGLKWVQCLNYLDDHRHALIVSRNEAGRPIRAGRDFEATRQSFGNQHAAMAAHALSILDSLRERRASGKLSPEQTAALKNMEELHTQYALA